ncbi:sensor histidine kinase [Lihuaxuella thermophila]|uniref:histidine kinase n=1 Tax=Lihuaxuella thermophila TaxID=1173111 RepID=A0A1H8J3S4_9BACL|nr:sensor histidine kinase [Lihuaxuella thermophila]SEN75583.1 Signal transduction histidine kinase [Lihuaxuella thermophila]
MKLFIRDHLLMIVLSLVQLIIVLLVNWLDGSRNLPTVLYSVFLGVLLLTTFLIYRFCLLRDFYRRLTKPLASLDDSLGKVGDAPLAAALEQLLLAQYRHYQQQLKTYERKRNDHLAFINQWVHQMKTPVSVIELIVQEEDDSRFAMIREESDRISAGLELILHAARLESFEQDFAVEAVKLRTVVDKVIHENKRLFINNHVYPEVLVDPEVIVRSDAKWLAFVLNQLVTNAVKYSAGSNQYVTVLSEPRGREMVLEIRDKGIGIPKSDLKRVFRPFFTGENGRIHRESTGIGLYLVQEVCKRLGHSIELESETGVGTTVRLIF